MALETQLVIPVKLLLHRFEFIEIQNFKGFSWTHREIEKFFKKLDFSDAKSFDTTFDTAFSP